MSGGGGFDQSSSRSGSSTQIDPTQLGFLRQLWGQGLNLANQQGAGPGQAAGAISNQLMPGLMQNMGQLTDNPFLTQLQQMSNPNNAMVQQNVDLMGQDLQRQFNESILPGISGNAIAGGALGGGRQGIAQGLAAQGVSDAFARGSADIRNQAYGQAQQAAGMGGNLLGQGIQTSFGAAPTLMNLGMSPYQQAWMPLQQLGGLIGSPTTIGNSFSRGDSFGMNFRGGAAPTGGT
jgi:hypothetical protein